MLRTDIWIKASASNPSGNCLQAKLMPNGAVGIRNSKRIGQAPMIFGVEAWDEFLLAAAIGEFNRPLG